MRKYTFPLIICLMVLNAIYKDKKAVQLQLNLNHDKRYKMRGDGTMTISSST